MALIPIVSKFHFYQQIRLLLRRLRDGRTPDAALLDEKLRIVSTLSLDAPRGEVEEIQQDGPDVPLQVTAWHNGLTGALGAMPTAYSEWLIERQYRYSDRSAKAFLDIFGHRLYCLDYLAWQKHHLCAQTESTGQPPLQTAIQALSGLLMSDPSPALAQHAPLFASPVRSMVNLERWLTLLYGVPAEIIPFTGGWRNVPAGECCQLGNPAQKLNTAPMMGSSRLEVHAHFDVVLGPMTPETSRCFLPSGNLWQEIWLRIRDYVGPAMDFSVSLNISSANLDSLPLGRRALGLDLCLGRNSESHLHQVRLPVPTL
ncbi:type VI secretion system baseplate subunit TssG [Enterobacter cloacae subsp. cloacae]|uniref:type VI secretion system baseplate subunit TssG n=1 Tax=Enterobacter TaxID=547 RepID=UPI001C5B0E9A|nr:type VI secretion system baseplate subunit TssG [Enterobacter cloacae]MBW4201902.1 type VI secretion system baseplate subunit TssG [Enterobacter cloacae subsp. cloacae]